MVDIFSKLKQRPGGFVEQMLAKSSEGSAWKSALQQLSLLL
jgi:hypothetical protein